MIQRMSSLASRFLEAPFGISPSISGVGRSPTDHQALWGPLALAALTSLLNGGCVSTLDLNRLERETALLEQENRLGHEVIDLVEQRTVLTGEITRTLRRFNEANRQFERAIAWESRDLSRARALIGELRRLETTLTELNRRHSHLSCDVLDRRDSLFELRREGRLATTLRASRLFEDLPQDCFFGSDDPAYAIGRLSRAIERFNMVPGHGEDIRGGTER